MSKETQHTLISEVKPSAKYFIPFPTSSVRLLENFELYGTFGFADGHFTIRALNTETEKLETLQVSPTQPLNLDNVFGDRVGIKTMHSSYNEYVDKNNRGLVYVPFSTYIKVLGIIESGTAFGAEVDKALSYDTFRRKNGYLDDAIVYHKAYSVNEGDQRVHYLEAVFNHGTETVEYQDYGLTKIVDTDILPAGTVYCPDVFKVQFKLWVADGELKAEMKYFALTENGFVHSSTPELKGRSPMNFLYDYAGYNMTLLNAVNESSMATEICKELGYDYNIGLIEAYLFSSKQFKEIDPKFKKYMPFVASLTKHYKQSIASIYEMMVYILETISEISNKRIAKTLFSANTITKRLILFGIYNHIKTLSKDYYDAERGDTVSRPNPDVIANIMERIANLLDTNPNIKFKNENFNESKDSVNSLNSWLRETFVSRNFERFLSKEKTLADVLSAFGLDGLIQIKIEGQDGDAPRRITGGYIRDMVSAYNQIYHANVEFEKEKFADIVEMHDYFTALERKVGAEDVEIKYSDEERRINFDHNNIEFRLAERTHTLIDIGEAMGICVGGEYYRRNALGKSNYIVYGKPKGSKNDYKYCIEINSDGRRYSTRQFVTYRNQRVDNEETRAFTRHLTSLVIGQEKPQQLTTK